MHVDNLPTLLARDALHSPNHTPKDGRPYRTIHDTSVQASRSSHSVPVGPKGQMHDYVPFYFGPLSVMLLKLKTGQVAGYNEGQEPLIYLKSAVETVLQDGRDIVFTDGHGLAGFTDWFDDVSDLDQVDWSMVNQRYWADKPADNDRQRRKQAEFLIHERCPWSLIDEIGVVDANIARHVTRVLAPTQCNKPPVVVRPRWYY